jgi:hypothetical protein
VPLPSLRKLSFNKCGDKVNVSHFSTLTQLQSLALVYKDSMKGLDAIAHLSGLTQLKLKYLAEAEAQGYDSSPFNTNTMSELSSALRTLQHLECLDIPFAPPGPMADALGSLTALTQLKLGTKQVTCGLFPLMLPGVRSLYLSEVTAAQLACITAPLLQDLTAEVVYRPGDAALFQVLCVGLLGFCKDLTLRPSSSSSGAQREQSLAQVMAVVGVSWRLTAATATAAVAREAARGSKRQRCEAPAVVPRS